MTRNATVFGALTLVAAALAAPAYAGQTSDFDVTINNTTRTASGAVGTARASSTSQNIGCSTLLLPDANGFSTTYLTCSAISSSGASAFCYGIMTGPGIGVPASMTDDSYLKFTWDANGQCTTFEVRNYSYYRPRQP